MLHSQVCIFSASKISKSSDVHIIQDIATDIAYELCYCYEKLCVCVCVYVSVSVSVCVCGVGVVHACLCVRACVLVLSQYTFTSA